MTDDQRSNQRAARERDAARARFNRACAQGWEPPAEGGEELERSLIAWEAAAVTHHAATAQLHAAAIQQLSNKALKAEHIRLLLGRKQ